jgi:hypothetical protein
MMTTGARRELAWAVIGFAVAYLVAVLVVSIGTDPKPKVEREWEELQRLKARLEAAG